MNKDLPQDIKSEWGSLVSELAEAGSIFFPRSTVPPRQGAVNPLLVGFGDGSLEGFCAMVYAVWPRLAGGSEVFLLMAKSRVSPLGGTTVPRMEISSGALLSRLALLVARVCGFKLVKIVIALDSECSVSALTRYKGLIKPYFAHRAG